MTKPLHSSSAKCCPPMLVQKYFSHNVVKYALIYLAFAYYGIFFFVGYTESLFLLLTLAAFLFLQRGFITAIQLYASGDLR